MKVVLLEDVKGIGQKGQVKEVKDGYSMNFLIPQKKAVSATEGNVKQAESNKAKKEESAQESLEKNKKELVTIEGKKVVLKTKAQDEKLFGALSEKDIKTAMMDAKIELLSGALNITTPIKTVGEHEIEIIWDGDLKTKFTLVVEGEK